MPRPLYGRMAPMGVRIFRCQFPKGSWQTYYYPRPIAYRDMPTCHIQTYGRMIEPTGVWPDHLAGWMSRRDDFVIPSGVFTRFADEDSERWCCTGVSDEDDTSYVQTHALRTGERIPFAGETIVVVARGLLRIGSFELLPGRAIRVRGEREALAATDSWLFEIDADALRDRYPDQRPAISA
jgi:hypothetical protein